MTGKVVKVLPQDRSYHGVSISGRVGGTQGLVLGKDRTRMRASQAQLLWQLPAEAGAGRSQPSSRLPAAEIFHISTTLRSGEIFRFPL